MKQTSTPSQPATGGGRESSRKSLLRAATERTSRLFHEALRTQELAARPAPLSRLLFWRQAKTADTNSH